MALAGVLIAESIRLGAVLNDVVLTVTKIKRVKAPASDGADLPAQWTLIEFEADESDARRLASALESVLLREGGWYCDFRTAETTFVVFAGRTFAYPRGNPRGRSEAADYGRTLGVPEGQLDWPV